MVCTLIDVMWPLSHNHSIWLDRLIGIALAKDLILIPIQTSGCSACRWRRQRRRRCRPCPPQRSPHASPAETYPKFGPLLFYIKMCQKGHNWAKFEAHPFDRIWMNGLSDHPHLPALLPESILWETDLLSNRRKKPAAVEEKIICAVNARLLNPHYRIGGATEQNSFRKKNLGWFASSDNSICSSYSTGPLDSEFKS